MPKRFSVKFAEQWRTDVLGLLRRPSTFRRIHGNMAKHYAHFRRQLGKTTDEVRLPPSTVSKREFIVELERMEREAWRRSHDFAGAPVMYRPPR